MTNDFTYLLRVRYAECDAQKVVFNGRYSDYVDIAINEYFRSLWGDYNDLLARGIDNQVVSFSINWSAPAHFDEVLAARVKTKKIGNSSFTLQVDFYHYESGRFLSSADIVYVMVTVDSHQKMTVPPEMREALENGVPGVTINHAGVELKQDSCA